jgi:hypothetical protein
MNVPDKQVVYTAMPKFLRYYNLEIGKFVEYEGHTALTPWQYPYAMGEMVDYQDLKDSLHNLILKCDKMWVFGEDIGVFPLHEEEEVKGIGLTDGVVREVRLAGQIGMEVQFYHINSETGEIEKRLTTQDPVGWVENT